MIVHYTTKKTIEIKRVNRRQNYSATALLLENAKYTTTGRTKAETLKQNEGRKPEKEEKINSQSTNNRVSDKQAEKKQNH